MEEIWKQVAGYNDVYFVSNNGIVKSVDHFVAAKNNSKRIQFGRILKQDVSTKGYLQVSLSCDGKKFHTGVHRLVAMAFIPNPNNLPQVNHLDGDKTNNNGWNLEWSTNQDNQIHAVRNGLVKHNVGEDNHNSKFTNDQIVGLRKEMSSGATLAYLSEKYKISVAALSKIKNNQTYINQ